MVVCLDGRRSASRVSLRLKARLLTAMAVLHWTLLANLMGKQVGVIHWRLVSRDLHVNAQIKMGN